MVTGLLLLTGEGQGLGWVYAKGTNQGGGGGLSLRFSDRRGAVLAR